MNNDTPVEKTRQAISYHLSTLGAANADSLHETMLIHNGLFCGRKFQVDDYEVVWFLEEDEIKFFSPVGDLLKSCSAIECTEGFDLAQQKRAA
ncbi:MAG: hypothetical protein AAF483_16265 [Planctomycetota bacterium]